MRCIVISKNWIQIIKMIREYSENLGEEHTISVCLSAKAPSHGFPLSSSLSLSIIPKTPQTQNLQNLLSFLKPESSTLQSSTFSIIFFNLTLFTPKTFSQSVSKTLLLIHPLQPFHSVSLHSWRRRRRRRKNQHWVGSGFHRRLLQPVPVFRRRVRLHLAGGDSPGGGVFQEVQVRVGDWCLQEAPRWSELAAVGHKGWEELEVSEVAEFEIYWEGSGAGWVHWWWEWRWVCEEGIGEVQGRVEHCSLCFGQVNKNREWERE